MPLTEKALKIRDAERNIGEELLKSIRDVKEGLHGAIHQVKKSEVLDPRSRTDGLKD